jgi:hypothetical protein
MFSQPITEVSNRTVLGFTGGRSVHKIDNYTAISELLVPKMWEARLGLHGLLQR